MPEDMDVLEALEKLSDWVGDAESFVQAFSIDELGNPNRPIADESFPLDEALGVIRRVVEASG